MTETKPANTIARERVDELTLRHGEPDWLRDVRLAAWELYLQTPMPTARDEAWRRTEIAALDLSNLKTLDFGTFASAPAELPRWFQSLTRHIDKPSGVLLELAMSAGYKQLSENLEKRGVIFTDIAAAIERYPEAVKPFLTRETSGGDGKFTLMTKALFNCGLFLYVPSGMEIAMPFISGIGLADTVGTAGGAIFPRLIVVAGAGARLNLIHVTGSPTARSGDSGADPVAADNALVSGLVEIFVGANANVSYLEVQQFGHNVFAVSRAQAEVGRDAQFTSLAVATGGRQTKSDIVTLLNGPGAANDVLGIVLGSGRENYSYDTIEEHNDHDTRSNINFRVALKDAATSVYQGTIKVAKPAQRTNAYQQNKNLLLGGEARADSIPRLEILADDVRCSHGATVGPVDKEQLFYLMSRGLTRMQAEELVVLGFFSQILEQFGQPFAREWLSELISRKVYGY